MVASAALRLSARSGCDQAAKLVDLPIPEGGFLLAHPVLPLLQQRCPFIKRAAFDEQLRQRQCRFGLHPVVVGLRDRLNAFPLGGLRLGLATLSVSDQPQVVVNLAQGSEVALSQPAQGTVGLTLRSIDVAKLERGSGAEAEELAAIPSLAAQFAQIECAIQRHRGFS